MGSPYRVASVTDVPPGGALGVEVQGRRIALFNVEGTIYAIDDTCTHNGGPLSEGVPVGTAVVCPWHGAEFDLGTGEVLGPPAESPVRCYPARVVGDTIEIEL
jgi:3-phenylpropionate/trans-cinnamate dioxygenase ferredoxin component